MRNRIFVEKCPGLNSLARRSLASDSISSACYDVASKMWTDGKEALSRRDVMKVARYEVPGSQDKPCPSRREQYDRSGHKLRPVHIFEATPEPRPHLSRTTTKDEDDLQRLQPLHLRRVMKDDANGVAAPRAETAYTVAKVHSIGSTCTLHRAMMNGESHGIALRQRHNLGTGLHARSLLGQNKLTSTKVLAGFRE